MLTRWLAAAMALPVMMSAPSAASDDAPTYADVERELGDWGLVMAEHAGGGASSFEDIEPAMARSFWYEGLSYEQPYTIFAEPEPMAKLARRCKKKYGAHGVVRRGMQGFLACLAISSYEHANGDNSREWSEAALGKLPPPFRSYRAKLARLAKDHWLVVSHFRDTEEHREVWNLYVVERNPDLLIAGVLVGRVRLPAKATP